ncbi:ATP-binding cassette domain-containing protein [Veillonella sp.]|uniref:ABC transporter ATP-binding protein n=1 Tax=Veillonella sp. TaxID=1926307 RepID=UPI0025FDFFBB|nr:ATP-binding cassette domain-containing protein [Veillonella sp.]
MGLLPSEIVAEQAADYVAMNSIFKQYGNYEASKDVNFQIKEGSIVALLGPSGSGKTTILRMLAGLEHPDRGDIYIAGQRVNEIVPAKRGIGFVFQNYALFRHMTVFDNIAFGLTVLNEDKGKIERRVTELLELVGLSNLRNRYPGELSGGQRQRVAFARALAPRPHVLLLDEPFAAIDAKVKHELRQWLKTTIKKSGITSIFVTHDQEEAVELADEIIVTNNGRIEQMGTPEDVYGTPATPFVAGFMGKAKGIVNYETLTGFKKKESFDWAIVRPEFVAVFKRDADHGNKSAVEQGVVESVTFQGTRLSMQIRIGEHILEAEQPIEANTFTVGEEVDVLIYRLFLCSNTDVHIAKNKALEIGPIFYI